MSITISFRKRKNKSRLGGPLSAKDLFLGLQYLLQSSLPVFVLVYRNADSLGANRVALSNLDDKRRLNIWHSNCINFRCPDTLTLKDNRSEAIYWYWYCQLHSKLKNTINVNVFLTLTKQSPKPHDQVDELTLTIFSRGPGSLFGVTRRCYCCCW